MGAQVDYTMPSTVKGKSEVQVGRLGTVVGTGFLTLDVVLEESRPSPLLEAVGGTVGNVLSILAALGASAIPVSRLADDAVSLRIRQELDRLGLCLDFLSVGNCVPSPVVYQINKSFSRHEFSFSCPHCGEHAPKYQPIEAEAVRALAESLPEADVFFFDRVSLGSLELARTCAQRGGLVFFEPSSIGDEELFEEALSYSHIVKYSEERLGGISHSTAYSNIFLEIKTHGKTGLSFRKYDVGGSPGHWHSVGAFDVSPVLDTAGAGDWCTAGVIYSLIDFHAQDFRELREDRWEGIMRKAQAFSAINCLFAGARGAMLALPGPEILSAVEQLYSGEIQVGFSERMTHAAKQDHASLEFVSACRKCGDEL